MILTILIIAILIALFVWKNIIKELEGDDMKQDDREFIDIDDDDKPLKYL